MVSGLWPSNWLLANMKARSLTCRTVKRRSGGSQDGEVRQSTPQERLGTSLLTPLRHAYPAGVLGWVSAWVAQTVHASSVPSTYGSRPDLPCASRSR